MGSDYEGYYHRSAIQGAEYTGGEEVCLAEGVSFLNSKKRRTHPVKYTDGLRAKEQEEREARLAKLRPALRNMLKGNPNVFHYTTFATADRLFAQHPIWQQAKVEAERRLVFEEYVAELKQREMVCDLLVKVFRYSHILLARVSCLSFPGHFQSCRTVQEPRSGRTHQMASSSGESRGIRRMACRRRATEITDA